MSRRVGVHGAAPALIRQTERAQPLHESLRGLTIIEPEIEVHLLRIRGVRPSAVRRSRSHARVRAVVARVLQKGGPAPQDHPLGGFRIADEEVEVKSLRSVGVRPRRWPVTGSAFAERQPRPSTAIASEQVGVEGGQLLAALSGAGDHDGADARPPLVPEVGVHGPTAYPLGEQCADGRSIRAFQELPRPPSRERRRPS